MSDTTGRLLSILSLLQSGGIWSGPQLAERLGVTVRTVRRDVERLRDLGYPIDADAGVVGVAAVAHGDIEIAVGAEGQRAAVVVHLRLVDLHDQPLGVRIAPVRVVARKSGLTVMLSSAEALQSGNKGESIRVRNRQSGRTLTGRIVGPAELEIRF
jgi:biotin operon repressor